MEIKSIQIKNVRGLQDHLIELNMIPNKPSLLVAPNGSGKSSFALAFLCMNTRRMKLNESDLYNEDKNNSPEIILKTSSPNDTYIANGEKNEISKKFGIFVINNKQEAKSSGLYQGYPMGKPKIIMPSIVIIDKIPTNVVINDDFTTYYHLEDAPRGMFPLLNTLLQDSELIATLDFDNIKIGKRELKKIGQFIDEIRSYTGTIEERYKRIEEESDYHALCDLPALKYVIEVLCKIEKEQNKVKTFLKAMELVCLYNRKEDEFKKRKTFVEYNKNEQNCRAIFSMLKGTWKEIKPHQEKGQFILKIGDTSRISNGERDSLAFFANLMKASFSLTKENNILIIDEVFDYLDDANMMAVQYYISKFINKCKHDGKNVYPIILSHLNPSYFHHYWFKEMKVYYLCQLPNPKSSDNIKKLLRQRGLSEMDDISKYMFHYHTDIKHNMGDLIGSAPKEWKTVEVFKNYCEKQLENYLGCETYDPMAVCVALREHIEKEIYDKLTNEEEKTQFLEEHGTAKKLEYAVNRGIVVPEVFFLLGNIHNAPLHVDEKHGIKVEQALYSKLENNIIREMIDTLVIRKK